MDINGKEIEPKIANLVSLLNKVNYLETISSCHGHFPKEIELEEDHAIEVDQYAHVIFDIPDNKEKEFENLIYRIQSQTSLDWCDYNLEISKRYFCIPHSDELSHNWQLKITPFMPNDYTSEEKREITGKAIFKLENILEDYLL
jgi:hypothetical protein